MILDITKHMGYRDIWFPGELSSRIIKSMLIDGWAELRTKEIRNFKENGFYDLLDEIFNVYRWDPQKLTIKTTNYYEIKNPYRYKVEFYPLSNLKFEYLHKNFDYIDKNDLSWNKEKYYGMFIRRANKTRIRGLQNNLKFEYREYGLTSFNDDLNEWINPKYASEFFYETDSRFSEINYVKPYSDIEDRIFTAELSKSNFSEISTDSSIWFNVYKKIPIELIFETSEEKNNYAITEKILRPMVFKRPFLIVAPSNYLQELKVMIDRFKDVSDDFSKFTESGFKTFDHVIPIEYDKSNGIYRVDAVFDILKNLIDTGKIFTILEDCAEDIEYNYNLSRKFIKNTLESQSI